MTSAEYATLVLATRDSLFNAIRAALPAECQMEKKFIQTGKQNETGWTATLVNTETDTIRIFVILMTQLKSADAEKTAGAKNFKPSIRMTFELFHDQLVDEDTQTPFEEDALKLQFAIETNKNLQPKGYIDSYEINLGALASERSLHYGRGEVIINFREIRYDG